MKRKLHLYDRTSGIGTHRTLTPELACLVSDELMPGFPNLNVIILDNITDEYKTLLKIYNNDLDVFLDCVIKMVSER